MIRMFKSLLGERDCSVELDLLRTSKLKDIYQVTIRGQHVTVKARHTLASLAGFPPLYYFKGKMEQCEGRPIVVGEVLMSPVPKATLVAWWTLVFFVLAAGLAECVYLAVRFMFFASENIQAQLASVGFLIGSALLLGVFGLILTNFIKAVSIKQRKQFDQFFCNEDLLSMDGNNLVRKKGA